MAHPFLNEFEERLLAGRHEDWVEAVIDKTDGRAEVLSTSLAGEHRDLMDRKRWLEADALLVNAYVRGRDPLLDREADPWVIRAPYTELGLEL